MKRSVIQRINHLISLMRKENGLEKGREMTSHFGTVSRIKLCPQCIKYDSIRIETIRNQMRVIFIRKNKDIADMMIDNVVLGDTVTIRELKGKLEVTEN